jgi:hypothetical protein
VLPTGLSILKFPLQVGGVVGARLGPINVLVVCVEEVDLAEYLLDM